MAATDKLMANFRQQYAFSRHRRPSLDGIKRHSMEAISTVESEIQKLPRVVAYQARRLSRTLTDYRAVEVFGKRQLGECLISIVLDFAGDRNFH